MNRKQRQIALAFILIGLGMGNFTSCTKDETVEPAKTGIAKAELILTEISGQAVEAHGDHFHGLDAGVEGDQIVIKFDETGKATENGHLHIEADADF